MIRLIIPLFCLFLLCCNNSPEEKLEIFSEIEKKISKESSIDINKNWIKDESFLIDQFCKRHHFDVQQSKSGVRFFISEKTNGIKVSPGDIVTIAYEVRLLNSDTTLCYSSGRNNFNFIVEMDNIESGLHEAITYFKKGEKGFVVLPHYLAHGLIGNMDKIPPLSPVLYKLELLDVKKI